MYPNTDPAYLASQGLSKTIPERFLKHLAPPNENGCIEWTGFKYNGYGQINTGLPPYRPRGAHIVSYAIFNGPVPDDKMVLHKCPNRHNRACVNPAHLQLGTQKENAADTKAQITNGFLAKQVFPKGDECAQAKITNEQAEEIRAKYATGHYSQWKLAREYGLNQASVWCIIHNQTYKREPSRNPAP